MNGRPWLALACFVVGAGLIFLVENPAVQVPAFFVMATGIALGVAAIASPEFLERDEE